MAEDWFDPAGFLLAVNPAGELLGFHWTKVHPRQGPHPAIGEVYVVGVTPAAQGLGLGKALTVAGIRYLQSHELHSVMLYVDADNTAAVALYQKLGFVRWDVDVMYAPLTGT
jgi:mycothiol synthase